jgi:hypothetical protein
LRQPQRRDFGAGAIHSQAVIDCAIGTPDAEALFAGNPTNCWGQTDRLLAKSKKF